LQSHGCKGFVLSIGESANRRTTLSFVIAKIRYCWWRYQRKRGSSAGTR